jgi:hypothetical protein
MARIVTCTLRIASTSLPLNIPLNIAAQIFTAAGVVLVFVINLIFTQRILRAHHPSVAWHKAASVAFLAIYALILVTLIMLVTVLVQSFYTLSLRTHAIDRSIVLYGLTFFAVVSFLPLVLLSISLAIPRQQSNIDKFGSGRLRHNIAIVMIGTLLVCLGATFRCATQWMPPVSRREPLPGYFSRACFYVFNFGLEIIVVYFYAGVRIDKRFWVPNGAKGPGSYSRNRKEATDLEARQRTSADDEEATIIGSTGSLEMQSGREKAVDTSV